MGKGLSLREEAALRASAVQEDNYDSDDDALMTASALVHTTTPYQQQQTQPSITIPSQHLQQQQPHPLHPPETPVASTATASTTNQDLAASARSEWRRHGAGVTQVLEEKRRLSAASPGQMVVRVISAETRVDLSGRDYTAYVIKVTNNNNNNDQQQQDTLVEHRYSDFCKLHTLLESHNVKLEALFPSKSWAGRMGNWTPSKAWAPDKHESLIQYRTTQLDVWLVDLMIQYNQGRLPQPVATAVYEFLTAPDQPPCHQVNHVPETSKLHVSNPLTFTLGSSIRQATHTVQTMVGKALTAQEQGIPLDLLHAAKGLALLTVVKAGVVVSGRAGTGLVIARLDDTTWSAPCALGTIGMGWGALIGGDVTQYLVVLTTPQAVTDLVSQKSVQLGAELGVAVGPVGRSATSHVATGDWTLHPAYAYAHSQGLFVGMSLEGSVVSVRPDVNAKFYGQTVDPSDLLKRPGPKAAEPLYQALNEALQVEIPENSFRPSHLWSPQQAAAETPTSVADSSAAVFSPASSSSGGPVTIDTMHAGPSPLLDQATPSTVVHSNQYNSRG